MASEAFGTSGLLRALVVSVCTIPVPPTTQYASVHAVWRCGVPPASPSGAAVS